MRPRRKPAGFTLVELLVVIAIIGILAGLISAGLPRAIRMAKMSATKNNLNQIRTILTTYYTDNGSFPPAYGYLSPMFISNSLETTTPTSQNCSSLLNPEERPCRILALLGSGEVRESEAFFLLPWMSFVREHGNDDLYDNWSQSNSYDTDGDGVISRLEFAPRGQRNGEGQPYTFGFTQLYQGTAGADTVTNSDLAEQLNTTDRRPFIYLPVNVRQARQFANIVNPGGNQPDPRPFNLSQDQINDIIAKISFPPPSYDAFVLISVGPNFSSGTNGLIVEFGSNTIDFSDFATNPDYPEVYQYHILGLATYFLATRDAQDDKELDFDFTSRSSGGQGKNAANDMPGKFPKGDGPIIFVGGA